MTPVGETSLPDALNQRFHVVETIGGPSGEGGALQIGPGQERTGMAQPKHVRVVESEQLQIPARRRTYGEKHVIPSTLDILIQIL